MAVPGLGTSLIYAHGNSWEWATCEQGQVLITTARRSSRLEIGETAFLGLDLVVVAVQDTSKGREKVEEKIRANERKTHTREGKHAP
jgi:hypothetical protein